MGDQVIYKTESEAFERYNNQCPVTETVSKPQPVKLTDGLTGWVVRVRIWSLD